MDSRFTGLKATEARKFCELLVASGIVSPDDLGALVSAYCQVNAEASAQSARNLSDFLIARGVITAWQADKLRDGRYKGFFIDHYILVDFVRAGDESSTFAALDTVANRRVLLEISPVIRANRSPKASYRVVEQETLHDNGDNTHD